MQVSHADIVRWAAGLLKRLNERYPEIEAHDEEFENFNFTLSDATKDFKNPMRVIAIAKDHLGDLSEDPLFAALQYGECRGLLISVHALNREDFEEIEFKD